MEEDERMIEMSGDLAKSQESWLERIPAAKATFMAWTLEDALEGQKSAFAITRNQARKTEVPGLKDDISPTVNSVVEPGGGISTHKDSSPLPTSTTIPHISVQEDQEDTPTASDPEASNIDNEEDELDSLLPTTAYWGARNPPPNIHIGMSESYKAEWLKAYEDDQEFGSIW
jgi:hypothetical protein